jgi:tRNA pseudouridine13 synthase
MSDATSSDPTADLPFAWGGPLITGQLRRSPEDFQVEEVTGFEPSGRGEHAWLVVRKRGANTLWVARQLARLAGVRPDAVGFAGLKDRAAVTTQAFTVHLPGRPDPDWASLDGDELHVLAVHRHDRKLRRGTLRGNRFRIVVRGVEGDAAAVDGRLRGMGAGGVPNYFGSQRFGRDGGNLALAEALLCAGRRLGRDDRGLALSAARSWLFNTVVALRVRDGTWNRALAGDVMQLDGRRALFRAEAADAETARRCDAGEIQPTGPLPGRDAPTAVAPTGLPARLEDACLAAHRAWVDGLARQGVESDRRALRAMPRDLAWSRDGDALELRFFLTAGAFATALLRELVGSPGPSSADDELA